MLWEFLLDLLMKEKCPQVIGWTCREMGEFVIKDANKLAQLWGDLKKRPTMSYAKLSRGIRYYYEKGIMMKIPGRKYAYRFTDKIKVSDVSNRRKGGSLSPPRSNVRMTSGSPSRPFAILAYISNCIS